MKLVALWLAAVIIASCSINHRSGEYSCNTSADCTGDRVCSQNFCVLPNGGSVDAPAGHADAPVGHIDAPSGNGCPLGCSACDPTTKSCTIECGTTGAANCGAPITCPAGWSCEIDCKNQNNCRSGVNCTNSDACHVICSGAGSCRNVACGAGPCKVECTGQASCSRFVQCGTSCKCDIQCTNQSPETCAQDITCGQIACDVPGGGCTSMPSGLCSDTCP